MTQDSDNSTNGPLIDDHKNNNDVNKSKRTRTSPQVVKEEPLIKNFRKAAGLNRVYRCGNTDGLGHVDFDSASASTDTLEQEEISRDNIIHEIMWKKSSGLILDLRSDTERNEALAQAWMNKAPKGGMQVKYFTRNSNDLYNSKDAVTRCVYRIDLLSPQRLFDYMMDHWISSPLMKLQYTCNLLFNTEKLHDMRMDILNERGIQGLYEAILETSGEEFCAALKAMTIYLEENHPSNMIIVHCVQGKDRTGLVIMLCQAILCMNDEEIAQDYHKSEQMLKDVHSSKNIIKHEENKIAKGKLNKNFFSGSPTAVMMSTLTFIKGKYGSIDSYLDMIGFDELWRKRFRNVMLRKNDATLEYRDDSIKLPSAQQLQSKL
eukprot:CAMPEP_0176500480 /NCGR_PEP_ID=MMETSP0200_2-20121128/13576_1 /TAXON_ID=947934 /ORGANISM="Chaetoceros sp., Strain GSL56" /LENGTH=375 /DNA_ID=CAMNT_0017899155 /DNA_START=108 /DNA_END=1235 /DNA_ORIENTATION=-